MTDAELTEIDGFIGNYKGVITQKNKKNKVEFGTIVVATGFREIDLEGEYQYGKNTNILSQTELEKKLLEYLVLIPATSEQQQAVAQAIAGEALDLMRTDVNTINPGATSPLFTYSHSRGLNDPRLMFVLAWSGSSLKLSVYRPNGSLYHQLGSSQSPIEIVVPDPESGNWKYRVTGVDVPYNNYPYVVGIAAEQIERVYLPLVIKRE